MRALGSLLVTTAALLAACSGDPTAESRDPSPPSASVSASPAAEGDGLVTVPDVVGKDRREAVQQLREVGLGADQFWTRAATCQGSTSVVRQRPQPGRRVEPDTRVVLLTGDVDCHRPARHSRVGPVGTRVADRFVRFARGEATAPPRHALEVTLLLGNRPVGRIPIAQSNDRHRWRGCPDRGYAAASCPVDFLAPFISAGANGTPLDYTRTVPRGVCLVASPSEAHLALLSHDRVVITPDRRTASCASDFRLELFLGERDALVAVNLVLTDP